MTDHNTASASSFADDRQGAVDELYLRNFDYIRELIDSDPTLRFETADRLMQSLAARLCAYRGPLNDVAFQEWAADAVLPAVSFASIYDNCAESVRTAIRRVFATCLDLGITPAHYDDAEQNTWLWAWLHLSELRDPAKSKASTKTRLYAAARFQALTVRKSLLRARERLSNVALSRLGTNPAEYEFSGIVVEPLSQTVEFNPYERRETVEAAA